MQARNCKLGALSNIMLQPYQACSPAKISSPYILCHHYAFIMTEIIPHLPLTQPGFVWANMSKESTLQYLHQLPFKISVVIKCLIDFGI